MTCPPTSSTSWRPARQPSRNLSACARLPSTPTPAGIYGDALRWLSTEDAARMFKVDAGGRTVWWQEYVRCLPVAPGKRIYLVHLVNPPEGDLINDSQPPKPLKDLRVSQHVMKAKPDATVHATAGGHPAILTRPFGKGQVCFVTIAPLGDAPAGQTAFWDWPQWPRLMESVVKELIQ